MDIRFEISQETIHVQRDFKFSAQTDLPLWRSEWALEGGAKISKSISKKKVFFNFFADLAVLDYLQPFGAKKNFLS